MASTIQIRVDDELKAKSDELFTFEIKRACTNPYDALSEAEFLEKLEKSRQNAAEGKYRDALEVSRNMREKYGL